ncbi:ABC transporter ATP-binding protein [Anaerosacchariphilus polymeriproducens]|uniref:ABC transporter ATP-binding protein n=2 Tax=Anaerosacchariphilus polymeriproducens TaxID=1812858 RepID=A0A371AWB2_9FIRM|nr:ABC transporter ATP-binding protein [Anaerosacchariphilus polymeriproducens]
MEQNMKNTEKRILQKILKSMSHYKWEIGGITLCYLIVTATSFLSPILIAQITDKGMLQKNMQMILTFSLLLLGFAAVEQLIGIGESRLFLRIRNHIRLQFGADVFEKLLKIKYSYYKESNSNEILERITTDVDRVSMVADRGIMYLVQFVLRIISGFIGLCYISWKLTLVVILIIPIKFGLAKLLSEKKKKKVGACITSSNQLSSWYGDMINGIREIRMWNLQYAKKEHYIKEQKKLLELEKDMEMTDAVNMSLDGFLEWLITCLLYLFGGYLVCTNGLTIGGVIAFISYSKYVTGPISALLDMKMIFAGILPSAVRLYSFLDDDEESGEGDPIRPEQFEEMEFENVSFAYEEKKILKQIHFKIKRGEKIAIIGKNGSGKTTLFQLLIRLLEPAEGMIRLNHKEISAYQIKDYRNLFGLVSQDVYLFADSIRDNISLGEKLEPDQMEEACKKSGLSEFVQSLPNGISQTIGKNGSKVSGGEKQKIALARALLKNRPIILLDEATSNMDVESDADFTRLIKEELKDKTILMITHRYTNLEGMDRIFELSEGRLVERGEEMHGKDRNH